MISFNKITITLKTIGLIFILFTSHKISAQNRYTVLFETGDYELTQERVNALTDFYQAKLKGVAFFHLVGHTDDAFRGMLDYSTKLENKDFRACQRRLRFERKNNIFDQVDVPPCEALLTQYGVHNQKELNDTLLKIQEKARQVEYEKYGVTNQEEYLDTIAKVRALQAEKAFDNAIQTMGTGAGEVGNLLYYVANVKQLGWINCDAFSNVSNFRKVNMKTDLTFSKAVDCKIVFRKRKSIMNGVDSKGRFAFISVPAGLSRVLALKYWEDQPYIHLEKSTLSGVQKKIDFQPASLIELKEKLKQLDQ